MYLYKTRLTDAQIEAYEQPEGTLNPECGGGINCAFCTLKMLDVYNKEFAEQGGNMCVPRSRTGNVIKDDEHVAAIKSIIKDVYGEDHTFNIRYFPGHPREILTNIASELGSSDACYLVYGSSDPAKGRHAVVLRRGEDGVIEMIDPQRGRKDEGTQYGITDKYAKELDDLGGRVDVTDNYYRVRGEGAIEFAMRAQSVAFGYWKTMEEFDEDFVKNPAVFTIGTLLIDSMIKTIKMELDEPAPLSKMKMEVDGGGKDPYTMYLTDDEMADPPQVSTFFKTSLPAITEERGAETETEEAVAIRGTKVADPDFSELYMMLSDVIAYPPDKDGNAIVKYLFIQEDDSDSELDEEEEEDMEGGVRREDKKKQGVKATAPRKDTAKKAAETRSRVSRATTAQAKRTTGPHPKTVDELKAEYRKHMETYADTMAPLREKLLDNGPPYTTVSDMLSATRFMLKSPAFLELPRTINQYTPGWENPGAGGQCIATGKDQKNRPLCWLCGNRTGVFGKKDGKSTIWDGKLSICDPLNNRFDCEHILPAPLMKFFGVIYSKFNEGKTTEKQKSIRELLYDGSCSSCNNAKSDGTYILGTQGTDGNIVVQPNRINILVDIITFVMKVTTTKTTKNKTTVTPCANGSAPTTFPIEVKGDQSSGWFTSIVTSAVGDKKSYPNLIRALLGEALPGNNMHLRADYVNTRARTGDFSPITNQKPDTTALYDSRTREQVSRNALESLRSAGLKDELETAITDPVRRLISSKLTSVPVRLDGNTPQVEIKEANIPATTAAKAAADRGFPVTIKLPATIDWILSRYVTIFNRMKMLCDKLNADRSFSDDWLVRLNKLYIEPIISIDEYVDIRVRQENNNPSGTEVKDAYEYEDEAEGQADPIYEESEMVGQQYDFSAPVGGQHIDISVHRGGRREVDVEL
jgi:hypothetical protein